MRIKYILLILLQMLLLVGIIAYREYWVETGERVLLRTAPVDPRDIFRGDYVQLRYEISTLSSDRLTVSESFKSGERVYVTLIPGNDGAFKATAVSKIQPWQPGQKFIQGRVRHESTESSWKILVTDDEGNHHTLEARWVRGVKKGDRGVFCINSDNRVLNYSKEEDSSKRRCSSGKPLVGTVEDLQEIKFRQLNVEYGIENYFVEEGKGRAIESARNAKDVVVEVALRPDGKGIITALFLSGKVVK